MVNGKNIPFVLIALALLLASCAPQDIPRDAERSWSLKGDFIWRWSRNVEQGCVAWSAKESYAVVFVLVDAQCGGPRDPGFLDDKIGVKYESYSDQLLFIGYSSWKPDSMRDIVRDEDGKSLRWLERCPYSLSQSQIDAIRVVVTDVLGLTLTDGERRMLHRVDKRLAETDGSALRVSYLGCVDVVNDRERNESGLKVDPWDNNSRSD